MARLIDDQRGHFTRSEILSQPEVWGKVLAQYADQAGEILAFLETVRDLDAIFTGCGSTYYLSLAAAASWRLLTGGDALGLPASEIWLNARANYSSRRQRLLIAVSRSGTTTETLRAIAAFRERGEGKVITLSCYEDTPLAKAGDLNLIFPMAQEQSVAQTRAFSSLLLAANCLAGLAGGGEPGIKQFAAVPEAGQRLLEGYTKLGYQFGSDPRFDRYYFLGSGARYGLACEVSLKMKEMSLSHSEPFHFLEFRHGPMSMVTDSTLLVGLLSRENRAREEKVLQEMKERGAQVLAVADEDAEAQFGSSVPEAAAGVLYLPILQLVAFEHSLAKGLNPDKPRNLTAVVNLAE